MLQRVIDNKIIDFSGAKERLNNSARRDICHSYHVKVRQRELASAYAKRRESKKMLKLEKQ